MEINPLLQAITTVTLTTSTTILPEIKNWRTGQLLEAIATSQTQNGQVKLQVGSTQFEAKVQFPVEPGQKLLLEVIKQADPPILQLAQTDNNKNAIVNAALRSVLAKQAPGISPLLSNISFLSSHPAQQNSALSPEILVLAKTFFNLLPDARRVSTPDGLQQAVKNSGVFLENKLTTQHSSSNNSGIQHDLKASLLKLRQAIQTISHSHTRSRIEPAQTQDQKSILAKIDKTASDRVLPNISSNNKSAISKSFANYSVDRKSVLNRAIINSAINRLPGETPPANKTAVNTPVSDKIVSLNHAVNKFVYGNTLTGKANTNTNVTGKSGTGSISENRLFTNQSIINRTFTFIPVASNTSNNLLSNGFLLPKSIINHLVTRYQQDGKITEQVITNTRNVISTNKQQTINTPDIKTNIQKALDVAKNVSDQVRDTAKTIRTTLGTPQRIASGSSPTPGASNIHGISTFFKPQNPANASQLDLEEILKAVSKIEDLNYMQIKKGLPLAQSRAQATVNQMSSIDHLITTLLKDVESSLARIQFHQLTTQQPQDTDTKQAWTMEIPVRKEDGADVFHLHVERDSQQQGGASQENKSAWTIRLSFTLEGLGPVHSRISLAEDKVSTVFWLEEKHTTSLFQKHLNVLQENLTLAGINIEKMSCLNGSPPDSEKYFFPQQLLHEKA